MSPSERDSLTVRASCSDSGNRETDNACTSPKRDLRFWLVFASMCICLFLSALEVSSVSTALPTIAHDLQGSQYIWVGSAYALSSTAFLPMSGGLAQAFGRRPAILLAIGLFAFGSGVCGGASSMNMLIAGRTIQGLGGGGIQSLTGIILADLVTLQERGVYAGLYGFTWCLAASVGPVVGGSLASQGQWRWLFYLNLPISLIACLSVVLFLDLPVPPGNYRDKFRRIDWIGNLLIIGSTVAFSIALTWGGTAAPWGSATVLVPFVLGFLGFVGFIIYEITLATHPLVPLGLVGNSTTVSGYVQSFCIGVNSLAIVYFFPVWFQACKGVSPVLSGIYTLGICSFAPTAILAGLSVKATGRYRPQIWVGWIFVVIAMSLLGASSTTEMEIGTAIGYLILVGLGMGALYATTMYPIQAPLPVTQNAPALAWMWYLRSFASVWGITIGNAVLQNELAKAFPASSLQSVLPGTTTPTLYTLIPELPMLPPHIRADVRTAFAHSLATLWQAIAAICVAGGVASLFMRGLALTRTLDPTWAIKHEDKNQVTGKEATAPGKMEKEVSA